MADKKGMGDDQLSALCANEINGAIGQLGTTVSSQREQAMREYFAQPYGNEMPDRSQIVMTDVRDAVEAALPHLMKIFTSGEDVVRFEPQRQEDEETAKQATDYANYIIWRDNLGFQIFYTWFKDALLQKNGVVKYWWDESKSVAEESYEGLTDQQFQDLLADDDVEPIEHTETQDTVEEIGPDGVPMVLPVTLHDVKVKRTSVQRKVRIDNIPPEEFLISRDAHDIESARFTGHRVVKTVSELIAMGFDPAQVEMIPTEEVTYWSTEATARRYKDDELGTAQPQSLDPSQRRVTVVEGYYRVDYDGDGIAELRQVWTASNGTPILKNEVWQGTKAPFAAICPCPTPHRFFGLSLADQLSDIQLIKTSVMRQILDSLYFANNQRLKVRMDNADAVNLDDLLTSRPGGIVRVRNGGDVEPIANTFIGGDAYPALEYLDSLKENRTGVTRNLQGLAGDELHKTASGAKQILNQSQERLLLIARLFAETGVTDLFRGVLEVVCTHQNEDRIIKLRGNWTNMNPREWATMYNVTINVGLGAGDKAEQRMILGQILGYQMTAIQSGSSLADEGKVYNTLTRLTEAAGLKSVDPYFNDPSKMPPRQPQPNPALEIEQMKANNDKEIAVMKAQLDAEGARFKAELDAWTKLQVAEIETRLKLAVGAQNANLSGGMPG